MRKKAVTEEVTPHGNPVSLIGMNEALKACIAALCGSAEKQYAQWAGDVTMQDKRICDVAVFIRVRE
jgi:hypothetical protein